MLEAGLAQLSIKACSNTWLPKTLTSVELQPIIAELCPAMVTYSPSNHSPQYKNIKLFLFLVLSKLIWKLVIALSWNNQIFTFLKSNGINRLPKSYQPLFMTKSIHRFISPLFSHHLLSKITVKFWMSLFTCFQKSGNTQTFVTFPFGF